uniref:Uncharacterized protein n=1 Tax=Tetradesmus obliquus TaxID=3088 RepID=A0A383V6H0_TETOB|eukprot:jgi/Sobl393_1/13374/SZX60731.1
MAMLLLLSSKSNIQWSCWQAARALATHVVVSAEAAQAVAQHGRGLVKLPPDMLQTLDGYFKEAGLTGKRAKLRSKALTEQLKALSRSQARGGLQPYRNSAEQGSSLQQQQQQQQPGGGMTAEQLQEQAEMEAELEQMAASFGAEALARHRRAREAAEAAAALALPTTKGGRLKTKAKAALLEHIAVHGSLAVPHEHLRAALDLPPSASLDSPQRNLALKKATPAYNEGEALAYALARLPGCYAACSRIFSELRLRLPGWSPKSLLDFGAGPGTASWAAQEVWPEHLTRLTAVEPSLPMRRLGERLEAARRFAHASAPLVRWRAELPPPLQGRKANQGSSSSSRADLVVASYVLGEVASPQQRAELVRHLWSLTSGLLVLVEPGTPAGHANILEARDAVLLHEARRAAKLHRRSTAAAAAADTDSNSLPTDQQQQQGFDPNLASKLGSKWYGAHVVAPCPHDGRCPLSGPGAKAWCHFGTRFQRPAFMQAAKALPGSHVNPADHQDERYSYVVLRRGVRPAAAVTVDISRSFAPASSSSSNNVFAAATESAEEQLLHSASSSSSSSDEEYEQWQHDEQALQQQLQQGHVHSASLDSASSSRIEQPDRIQQQQQQQQAAAAGASPPAESLFTASEMQQLSALLGDATPQQQRQQQPAAAAAAAAAEGSGHFQRVNAKLDGFGQGLVDRLMALEDAGVDWASGAGDGLQPQAAAKTGQVQPAAGAAYAADADTSSSSSSSSSIAASAISNSSSRPRLFDTTAAEIGDGTWSEAESDAEDEEWDEPAGQQQQQQQQQAGLQLLREEDLGHAAAASVSWSRIIRPPRKRGGHVILDVCAAAAAAAAAADSADPAAAAAAGADGAAGLLPAAGQLERHVVAKSDAKKWMGRAAYSMARDAQWGDLWCWRSRGSSAPK